MPACDISRPSRTRLLRRGPVSRAVLWRDACPQLAHREDIAQQLQRHPLREPGPAHRRRQHVVEVAVGALEEPLARLIALEIVQVDGRPLRGQLHSPLAPPLSLPRKMHLDGGVLWIGDIDMRRRNPMTSSFFNPVCSKQHDEQVAAHILGGGALQSLHLVVEEQLWQRRRGRVKRDARGGIAGKTVLRGQPAAEVLEEGHAPRHRLRRWPGAALPA